MAEERKTAKTPKKGPSPVLLVLLVLALGFVVFDFFTRERSTGPAPRQSADEWRVPRVVPPLPEEEIKTEEKREITVRPARDPFLLPAGVKKRVAKALAQNGTTEKGGTIREVLRELAPRISALEVQGEPGKPVVQPQPVWTGTIATTEGRVVIIRHNNKSYILQLGEILPGTDYRLVEIRQEMVVLQAPGGQLRLRRKEEAK
ncbi:MAG: hypothetical protein GX085_02260 [Firmicutes bacterium]|nr:hypothetical protein [Bacillota bacterium]